MVKPGNRSKRSGYSSSLGNAHVQPATPDGVNSSLTVDQLIERATDCESRFESDEALKFYNRALKRLEQERTVNSSTGTVAPDTKYYKVLQSSAFNLLELGRTGKAKERLLKLLEVQKEVDYEVFMYLGQLTEGSESLNYYRQGLEVLRKMSSDQSCLTTSQSNPNRTAESLQRAESNGFCAVAELYMTDLCDLPEAQSECKAAFEGAIQTDPSNPQAWLVAANFYTVTANTEAAREAIQRCLDLWWPKLENMLNEESTDAANAASTDISALVNGSAIDTDTTTIEEPLGRGQKIDLEEITGIPTTGLISLCRMMIEHEMYEKCASILESLLEEEEDNLEIYYLLTVVGRKIWKEEDPELLRIYATSTRIIASKLGDLELGQEMTELLDELPHCPETGSVASLELSSSDEKEDIDGSPHIKQ